VPCPTLDIPAFQVGTKPGCQVPPPMEENPHSRPWRHLVGEIGPARILWLGPAFQAGSVGMGARCSTCDQVPMSMGVPPTHREVRRERGFRGLALARVGTGCMAPGMVRSPHAVDLTQPSVHRGGYGKGHLVQGRGILSALETHPAQGAGTRERTGPDLGRRAPCCRVKGGRRFND
jgi:hypothetical protein